MTLKEWIEENQDKVITITKNGRFSMPLYKQAGNSMPVPVLEEIFKQLGLERKEKNDG